MKGKVLYDEEVLCSHGGTFVDCVSSSGQKSDEESKSGSVCMHGEMAFGSFSGAEEMGIGA